MPSHGDKAVVRYPLQGKYFEIGKHFTLSLRNRRLHFSFKLKKQTNKHGNPPNILSKARKSPITTLIQPLQ